MSAQMKFFVNGQQSPLLELQVADNLSEGDYFAIADENKSETEEYVSIFVEFYVVPSRENLVILQA